MSDKKKHRKSDPEAFRNYLADRMSGEERNAFEKELQKDPFAEEALEGMSSLSEEEVRVDLENLQYRLQGTGTGRSHRIVFYRIAAAVAGLILVSSAYLLFDQKIRELKSDRIARVEKTEKDMTPPMEQDKSREAPKEKEAVTLTESSREGQSKPVAEKPADQKNIPPGQEEKGDDIQQGTVVPSAVKNKEPGVTTRVESPKISKAEEQAVATPEIALSELSTFSEKTDRKKSLSATRAAVAQKSNIPPSVSGKIISAGDSSPIPGVTVMIKGTNEGTVTDSEGHYNLKIPDSDTGVTLVASFIGMESREVETGPASNLNFDLKPDNLSLDEVVVTGYGTHKKEEVTGAVSVFKADDDQQGYSEPKPIGGFDAFEKYIRENQKFPAGHSGTDRAVVVLKFSISENNRPSNILVLKSPGDDFSDEAIRLLKKGPDWSRATMHEAVIDVETRLRIVFEK